MWPMCSPAMKFPWAESTWLLSASSWIQFESTKCTIQRSWAHDCCVSHTWNIWNVNYSMLLTVQIICVPTQSAVLSIFDFDILIESEQAASMAPESHHGNHLPERSTEEQWEVENLRTSLKCYLAIWYQIVIGCTWLVRLNLKSTGTILQRIDQNKLYCRSGLNVIQTEKVCIQMDMRARAFRKQKGHLWKM